jgi:hypothetical protein
MAMVWLRERSKPAIFASSVCCVLQIPKEHRSSSVARSKSSKAGNGLGMISSSSIVPTTVCEGCHKLCELPSTECSYIGGDQSARMQAPEFPSQCASYAMQTPK